MLEFAAVPLHAIPAALEGYANRERLAGHPEACIIWDHLNNALEDAIADSACTVPIADYRRFLDRA